MRLIPTCAALLSLLTTVNAQSERRQVWQPVQEYFIRIDPLAQPDHIAGTRRLNSFLSYTHLGTDFGFHGPAEHTLQWTTDQVCAFLAQEPDAWAGMWHSLAGLAREDQKTLNFAAVWPSEIASRYQPRITGILLDAKGNGKIKIEIKDAAQGTVWSQTQELANLEGEAQIWPVEAKSVGSAKLINWTAEPGSEICVNALRLSVETPEVPFDEYVLAASYAKLARCFNPETGFVKDRGHLEHGAFESVPATGMFALATAVVAGKPWQMVTEEHARDVVGRVHRAVSALRRPRGLLPHFVRKTAEGYQIHPGTEYSTVDTAIYYHSLLLAAQLLNDAALTQELSEQINQIAFPALRLPGGEISHGLKDDGTTLLRHGWKDWGGETALVMMMEAMVQEGVSPQPMRRPGQPWQGTGFIPEIQSLFYPDFSSDEPDANDGVKWLTARKNHLSAQRNMVTQTWKGSEAAKIGLYGASAGEALHGNGYQVGGTDLPGQRLLHPHYVLMSAALVEDAGEVYALLARMEQKGWFTPWGLVENVAVDGASYLPMNGALNAAFETLGAYHLLVRGRQIRNAVYEASCKSKELRRGVAQFYPNRTGNIPAAVQAAEPGLENRDEE
jgi:hypothetical protein